MPAGEGRIVEVVERAVVDEMPVPDLERVAVERDAEARPLWDREIASLPERAPFDDVADLPAEQRLAGLGNPRCGCRNMQIGRRADPRFAGIAPEPNAHRLAGADEPERSSTARDLSVFLASLAQQDMERREDQRGGMLISQINGQPAAQHFLAQFLQEAGFHLAVHGLNFRRAMLAGATT